jgi:hypothetical protein
MARACRWPSRGATSGVSGGMCATLEAPGLIDTFDAVCGSSSGSANASYTPAGYAQSSSGLCLLSAKGGLVDQRLMLGRELPMATEEIVTSVLQARPHPRRVPGRHT